MKAVGCCPVCKSKQSRELLQRMVEYLGQDLHSNLLDVDYVKNFILFEKILHHREPIELCFRICTNCGLIFFSPRPDESDMVTQYKISSELDDAEERHRETFKIRYDNQRAFKIYQLISSFQRFRGAKVVDIGGGQGLNLKYFLNDNNCYVVDYVTKDLIDGAQYLCQKTKDVPKSTRYNLALCCRMLQHATDPVKEVLRIKNILEPGGLLYIEVPFGCWNNYKDTRNLLGNINFFSDGSLYYLLNTCGMRVRFVRVRPTLIITRYDIIIVAIAEKLPPSNKVIEPYQITKKQMESTHYYLRAQTFLLNVKLAKLRFLRLQARNIYRQLMRRRVKKAI